MDLFFALVLLFRMKKKLILINLVLMIAVLFSILFQSIDSYGHLAKERFEKKCYHKHNSNSEITHQHHHFDHCFVCEFALSAFTSTDFFSFEFHFPSVETHYLFGSKKPIISFPGSLYALRGPPNFIV